MRSKIIIFAFFFAFSNINAFADIVKNFEELAYDQCFNGIVNGDVKIKGGLTSFPYWRERAPSNSSVKLHVNSQLAVAIGQIRGNNFCEILVLPIHFQENATIANELEASFRRWAKEQAKNKFGSIIKDCSTDKDRRDIVLESNSAILNDLHLRSILLIYDNQPSLVFATILLPKAAPINCN